jgi:DNA-binding HxlR family transcriptional regulator
MADESDDIAEILEDIRRWVKILGIQEAKPILQDVLSSDYEEEQWKRRVIYHLTDGSHSTRDIADVVDVSHRTVSRRQNEWADLGLVERESKQSPYQHTISLKEAGLDVPDIPDTSEEDSDR